MAGCICSSETDDLAPICQHQKHRGDVLRRHPLLFRAGPTRLELATSGVTGRRSNQLNYSPVGGTGFEPVAAGV